VNVRTELRQAPTWWVLAAVVVALVVLTAKGAGLVILATVMLVERLVAVVLVVLTWVDERASGRAGLPPLATAAGELGRPR
jgi:hypothetical protein